KDINAVRFFTNAISTRTYGMDAVVTGTWPVQKSVLQILLSFNINKTKVYGAIQSAKNLPDSLQYKDLLFNREERGRIEQGQPRDKVILAIIYKTGMWEFTLRNNRFGKVASVSNNNGQNFDEFFSPKVFSGFRIAYSPKLWVTLAGGVTNIFNVYPDKLKNYANTNEGILIYSNNVTQFGYNGGYYSINMEFNF
ncbi:MAG TPA: hypothetical protein VM888_03995, partial [Chitinophagaceae bacterium]|nr:hypothetical protein [Chitinophagaceae bacterium]